VITIQEIPRPKPLPTPASTPYYTSTPGEQASGLLPSQNITQKKEFDPDNQINQHENPVKPHDHILPTVEQKFNQKTRLLYYAYIENANDSKNE
jgi:hypothetical protein